MDDFLLARQLIQDFKQDAYGFGLGVLDQVGERAASLGCRVLLIRETFPGSEDYVEEIRALLNQAGVQILAEIPGAAPNAPRADLERISQTVLTCQPDLLISFGGGSTIDSVKAANILSVLGGAIDRFFGTGQVTQALADQGKRLLPHLAIQTAASSSAHLTKYSNITDLQTGQKKLVVDPAIVPDQAVFDYALTVGAPAALTVDGGLDGISHALEVLYSAKGKANYAQVLAVALEAVRLVVTYLPVVLRNPVDLTGREALGLATDLGGYAIMLGGTNGAHLTSFSLVDVLSHGRACGLLNPYYAVFFAPAVENELRQVAAIYRQNGYLSADPANLHGRPLGIAAAQAMIAFEQAIGFPTRLADVPGFCDEHISRALAAAKDPQLKMKLENMPVPMTAEMVDEYMGPILWAAKTGDLDRIKNVRPEQPAA